MYDLVHSEMIYVYEWVSIYARSSTTTRLAFNKNIQRRFSDETYCSTSSTAITGIIAPLGAHVFWPTTGFSIGPPCTPRL